MIQQYAFAVLSSQSLRILTLIFTQFCWMGCPMRICHLKKEASFLGNKPYPIICSRIASHLGCHWRILAHKWCNALGCNCHKMWDSGQNCSNIPTLRNQEMWMGAISFFWTSNNWICVNGLKYPIKECICRCYLRLHIAEEFIDAFYIHFWFAKICFLLFTNRANLLIVTELGDRAAQGRAYGNLGNTHYLLGNFQKAVVSHEQV